MSHRATDCPQCGSQDIAYDVIHAFYCCDTCQHVWTRPEDDFDFDRVDVFLEQLNQIQPEYPPEFEMWTTYISPEYPYGHPQPPSERLAQEPETIRFIEIGSDANGMVVMRFESTLPGDTVLPNGFTPNSLFDILEQGLQEQGIKLIKD